MWEQIQSNRMRSAVLVAGMGVLLLLLGYFLGMALLGSSIAGMIIALIIWAIMYLVAYAQGDSILLSVSGAKKISKEDHPRLYNIVEEMKIASGLERMPDIYIIDDPALNAFATGRSAEHASVAVTSGLLAKLNRDELQGVIAHEIAHIRNRDVLLMSMAGVILGTVVILSWYASRMLFFSGMMQGGRRSSSSGGGGQAQIILLAIGLVLMILAPIAAQLLYYAISRRREYLADASGALYTRYPEGLASALEKIAGSTTQLKSANKATAPMYTVNPFREKGRAASDLTSTHPPISQRIKILRAMAGGGMADYEHAYEQVSGRGGGRIIPASALAGADSVSIRAASKDTGAVEPTADHVERHRDTSDLLWRLNNYRDVTCLCGTRLRVPPSYRNPEIRCPHCGRINRIS
jgi:heat shock protein HtpX